MKSDVIVIGGGIIGCAIAAELARRSLKVRLLERNQLGQEASWAAAGMLAPRSEAEATSPFFKLCQQSRDQYAAFVAGLIELTGLDPCYRQDGALQLAFNEEAAHELECENSWQFAAGLPIERLSGIQVRKFQPAISTDVVAAHFFPNEHQVDNRRLTEAIITAAHRLGVEFNLGAQVSALIIEANRVVGVIANDERYYGDKVINAAGSWAGLIGAGPLILPKLVPVRGQMAAVKAAPGLFNTILHSGHNYLVPRYDGTIVIGATTEFVGYDKSVTAAALQTLLARAQLFVPALAEAQFMQAWAGLRPATTDRLPLLGEHSQLPGLIFATGHYRNGILLVPITAQLIAELVVSGRGSTSLAPFSPERFILAK